MSWAIWSFLAAAAAAAAAADTAAVVVDDDDAAVAVVDTVGGVRNDALVFDVVDVASWC